MIVNLKNATDFSGFYIVYEGSVNLENKGTRGISHLIEHLICKTFQDLRNDFQKYAIDWNATTSMNYVVFYFTGLEKGLSKFRNKLLHRISDFDVTKKDFELERKIVLEEYSDTFNKQPIRHLNNIYRKYLDCYCPIGDKEDLQNLKFLDILRFYEDNMMNPSKIINISRSHIYENDTLTFSTAKIKKKYNVSESKNKLEDLKHKSEKESVLFMTTLHGENINILKLIARILGSGLESPLYQEVREKQALCYSISCDVDRFNDDFLMKIQTLTQKNQSDKVISIVKKVLNNPKKYITKERFDIIKNNLLNQQIKEELNRYINVQDEINPKEFSIYKDLKKMTFDKVIKGYEQLIDTSSLIIDID
jgi:predicted Zn-dependent peptidase